MAKKTVLERAMEEAVKIEMKAMERLVAEIAPTLSRPSPSKVLKKPSAQWTDEDIRRLASAGYDINDLEKKRSKGLVDELLELEEGLPEGGE